MPNSPTPEEGMEKTLKLINDWKNHPRVNIAVAAHATYSCLPDLIIEAKKIADKYNIPYNIHVAETQDEVDTIKKRFGKTPVGKIIKVAPPG